MPVLKFKKTILILFSIVLVTIVFLFATHHAPVDFNTEVKPILNKKCISCHGGVKQQADFSVLFRSEALSKTKSGKYAIIPGDPGNSEMIRRINLKDPEERMPYQHAPLSEDEIDVLTRWIKQGAKWGNHWAYLPVQQTPIPKPERRLFGILPGKKLSWVKNDIDYFIYDKLQQLKMKPSREADKATLLRRASLDIIGMPASASLAKRFLESTDDGAYEQLVDSLLASKHYGEKWTAMWLDLARYADTKGYERDDKRTIWRYRDWLINAFNRDQPYDRFLTEQIAGDLLPDATDDQLIATAFHRNTMTNDEGGTDNEEFRTAAVMDRVNTTWQALMGTTFSCVQCHSHPYDPFRHDEYYKFMAFFNDTRDEDTFADYPVLRHLNPEDSAKLAALTDWVKMNDPERAREVFRFVKTWQPSINSLTTDSFTNSELSDTKWLAFRNNASARLKRVDLSGKSQLLFRCKTSVPGGVWTIRLDGQDGAVLKTIHIGEPTKDWMILSADFAPVSGVHDLYFSYTNPNLEDPGKNGLVFDWFYFTKPLPGKDKPGYDSAFTHYRELITKNVPVTPVMSDNPPEMHRTTHVFDRGNWLVKGKEVTADVPHALNPLPKNAPRNRLGLAKWLTDKRNPLTPRTMVNRMWEQVFGTGLAETLEDLGTLGIEPTHRELLDYLAYQFMNDYNWSVKKLLKQMVMSSAYRQDSKVTKEALERDPYNRYYARGTRVRLSAEQVRDQALAVSGLLSKKMYGPGVMPWQPEGIWSSPYNGDKWKKSKGEDQYRRAVYTYWKRTAPYPSMISFDGVGREVCYSRRIRTNTPLQALVTLNDSVYLEASRHLAFAVEKEVGKQKAREQIGKAYEKTLFKPISANKLKALEDLYNQAFEKFSRDKERTCEMIGVDDEHNNPHTAALVVVMNALLNLDEVVTKS